MGVAAGEVGRTLRNNAEPRIVAVRMAVARAGMHRGDAAADRSPSLALFGFGKSSAENVGEAKKDAKPSVTEYSPEKAAKFFEHARNRHETESYNYAMQLWLDGLKQHPLSMEGLKGFFETARQYLEKGGKGVPRDVAKAINGGKSQIEKYLLSLLEWGCDPANSAAAVRAAVNAAELGLREPAVWIAERALKFAANDRRPRKDLLVQLMTACAKIEAYELAVRAGDAAVRLDPSDAKLAAEVRNMSAQATMTRGGYEKTGESGGFMSNVRDAAKQTRLEAEDRIAKTEETLDGLLAAAKTDYEARPEDKPSIQKYVKYLLERGRPEDEATAVGLLLESYEKFKEYRFKQAAGRVRIQQARRKIAELEKAAQTDEGAKERMVAARRALLDVETSEYQEQVAAYPTDLGLKFEYGKRLQESGRHEEAIAQFQESKVDVRLRAKSLYHLGVSFGAIDFNDEAIDTFRAALDLGGEQDENTKMALRYGLMASLMGRAAEQRSLADAEEAGKLASSIAIQQINYRDIRAKREELKALTAKLRGG